MNWFSLASSLFKPVADLVDNLHTSEEERLQCKAALLQAQTEFLGKALDYEKTTLEVRGKIVAAEATGQSFLQRNWRPIIMLEFGFIIAWNYVISPLFSAPSLDIPPDMWGLLKIGLGGYVIGRSAEKVVPGLIQAMKKKEE